MYVLQESNINVSFVLKTTFCLNCTTLEIGFVCNNGEYNIVCISNTSDWLSIEVTIIFNSFGYSKLVAENRSISGS